VKPSFEAEAMAEAANYYTNQALFTDHYLAKRMDAHPEWAEDIGDAFAQLQGLYQAKRDILDGLNEAQTEAEFVCPALEMLGFAYIPQAGFTKAGRQLRPDYALFADEAAKAEAYQFLKDEGKLYPRALAICDAKYWGRPFDIKREADPRDEFKNTNPSFQIVNYLVGTDVDWGILTNGRLWRLYYQKARSRASTYYEVDLGLILERGDRSAEPSRRSLEAFRYFYHFFRQEALVKDPATGRNFLERVYEGSATYALQVQEELKGLIFERIVPILAEGFVAWRRSELEITQEAEASLRQIFAATLTLLYRLLFLLYAESRELLPVSDRLGYYRYSLTRLKREAMARLSRGEVFSTVSDDLWNDLAALFRIIDRGDPALNVPTYNGGLFDRRSPKNAFLEEHRIADAYLVQALDLLTRRDDPDTGERRFIDYKDLDVRHLGSIYEGLLEFYLRIAQEDLAAVRERGVEVYKPLSEVSESRRLGVVREGELYLENDKGQRKATGSYYTPDYIVKYIVANTLGPIMDEREAAFAAAMAEWEAYRKKLTRAEKRAGARLPRRELEQLEAKAINCLLDIKVCDPAMGSGHFLVEAVAYLTDRIIDILNQYPENPVLARLAAIREQILANLKEQGIRIDLELLTDTNLLKRMVMKRCIYGVDLNPMAVELAKLSLWLDSFTVGAPLSFLDHHLKVGNSLIGVQVQEVRAELEKTAVGQYDMFGGPFAGLLTATELMRGVGLRTDATFDEVQESAELYAGFERAILPYKRVLDLWVSRYFGNERAEELLSLYGTEALRAVMDEGEGLAPEHQQAVKTARQLWEDKRFFHWDLEFPEVFIDLERSAWKQNPGFDVVVGNPPYVGTRELSLAGKDDEKAYYSAVYSWAIRGFDLYVVFSQQAISLLSESGRWSFIIPNKFWVSDYGQVMRSDLMTKRLTRVVDVSQLNVFPDASVYPNLVFAVGKRRSMDDRVTVISDPRPPSLEGLLKRVPSSEVIEALSGRVQVRSSAPTLSLSEIATVHSGTTGFQAAAMAKCLIEGPPPPASKAAPFIVTGNVDRFAIERENVMFMGHTYKLPFCVYDPNTITGNKWSLFKNTKVVVAGMVKRLEAALDEEGYALGVGLYALSDLRVNQRYLLALLNSSWMTYFYRTRFEAKHLAGGYLAINKGQLEQLPIRRIEFTTAEEARRELVEDVVERYLAYLEHGEDVMILAFVAARLEAEPEEADVVHDLLAYLAERMIEMHKEKQAEARGFLDWLAGYTGLPIDEWKLKSHVQAYWEHPWSELQRALSQNRGKMARDVEGREAQGKIKREFEDSMAKLKPLLARIEATDRLIDQIVYRLYGLTEEEIAVVEGM